MPNPLEAAATPDVAPVKDAAKEVSPFQSEINSLDTLNDLEGPNSNSSADKFLPKLSLDDATNGEATQMDSKVKESPKESSEKPIQKPTNSLDEGSATEDNNEPEQKPTGSLDEGAPREDADDGGAEQLPPGSIDSDADIKGDLNNPNDDLQQSASEAIGSSSSRSDSAVSNNAQVDKPTDADSNPVPTPKEDAPPFWMNPDVKSKK